MKMIKKSQAQDINLRSANYSKITLKRNSYAEEPLKIEGNTIFEMKTYRIRS